MPAFACLLLLLSSQLIGCVWWVQDDIEIREALRKYGTEMREQRTKDEKIYGGMFSA
jgi:hypothetical protein